MASKKGARGNRAAGGVRRMRNAMPVSHGSPLLLLAFALAVADVAPSHGAVAVIDVRVSLAGTTPTIAFTPTSFLFQRIENEGPATETLLVWNGSPPGVLQYEIETVPAWLRCYPTSGRSTGEASSHDVIADPTGLIPDDYPGTITITAVSAGTPSVQIPVRLQVQAVPEYRLRVTVAPPTRAGTVEPAGVTLYKEGSVATITATPIEGWRFSHWTGDARGQENPLDVLMDSDKRVMTHFRRLPGPNLVGSLDAVSPRPVLFGNPITLTGRVLNDGDQPATAPVPVLIEFWAVSRSIVDVTAIGQPGGWSGPLCEPIVLADELAPGESLDLAAYSPRMCFDDVPPGIYTIEMRIDPAGAVPEPDRGDNVASLTGVVILPDLPDLQVRDFDFTPEDVKPTGGDSIRLSARISNVGSQPTTGSFWVEFRVWPDPDFQPDGPHLCDSWGISQALNPGESVDLGSMPTRTTYALAPGVYYVGVIIDPTHSVAEQSEDNNTAWLVKKKLYVGPRPTAVRSWNQYR